MDPHWRYYQTRLNDLENDIIYQSKVYNQVQNRNNSHSAKLKYLQDELDTLRSENVSLQYEVNDLRRKTLDDRHHYHASPMPPKEQHIQVDVSPRYNKKDIEKKNVDFQREMHTHRDAYRNQMFGTDKENRFNLKVRNPNDESKDRNDDQIKQATERIDLHPGNFKPWVYQRPVYDSTAHHDGVYLFLRANTSGKDKIKDALKRNRTVLGISGGKLKGIAEPSQIRLLEGRKGWNINAPLARKGDFWAERHDKAYLVNDMILVFRFQSGKDAEAWLRTEPHLKNSDFPDPDKADIFYECEKCADETGYNTFLISEYPKILKREFAYTFAPRILKVIQRKGAIGEDHFMGMPHGVTFMRGGWVSPHSIFTCLRFRNEREGMDFYFDREMQEILLDMRRYVEIHQRSNPDVFPITSVLFSVHDFFGPYM